MKKRDEPMLKYQSRALIIILLCLIGYVKGITWLTFAQDIVSR